MHDADEVSSQKTGASTSYTGLYSTKMIPDVKTNKSGSKNKIKLQSKI
jgi:hypothetical protein